MPELSPRLAGIEQRGTDSLVINDLTEGDLPNIIWAVGPLHPESAGEALERRRRRRRSGQVDYLAVRSPSGYPISIGGIDYSKQAGAGLLWQLATVGELQGLGIGTRLIRAAEQRIRQRGLGAAILSVERDNPRARAPYERLGYTAYGQGQESWDEVGQDGKIFTYQAEVTLMCKSLA